MSKTKIDWPLLKQLASESLADKGFPDLYTKRLQFEFKEVESQGAERYWIDIINERQTFDTNRHGLLLPWLLGCLVDDADTDPIANREDPLILSSKHKYISEVVSKLGRLPIDVVLDDDKPDIDIDCLPEARANIKTYASERYGAQNVASVGAWTTFLFKAALAAAYSALGLGDIRGMQKLTKELPDDVNELKDEGYGICKGKVRDEHDNVKECKHRHNLLICPECESTDTETPTIARVLDENPELQAFVDENPEHARVVDTAARLVGRVSHRSKHAGAIIIADRDLFGNIPMVHDSKDDQWVSLWTEGSNTQLSKLGYNKWDILGLKNLKYIYECCHMVEKNHGMSFGENLAGWDYADPEDPGVAGRYWRDGVAVDIPLHDEKALGLANDSSTDSIFQFDTDLAKRILSNGVRSFWDLLIFNAMGHPGPMQSIPEYVENRDDEAETWANDLHPDMYELLKETKGVLVYQEQLALTWQRIAGFTGPEAQAARKAVAKKWRDKLKPVETKWKDGARSVIGKQAADKWWDKMVTFGRYAFNRSHAVSYCLWAYRCLWLKAHYREEWWASVIGYCGLDNIVRYITSARGDGVEFGGISIDHMTVRPTAHVGEHGNTVALGLINLKNVGVTLARQFADDYDFENDKELTDEQRAEYREQRAKHDDSPYKDIDDFIVRRGKSKTLFERLVLLGAFGHLHPNIKATWMWYLHKYAGASTKIVVDGEEMKASDLRRRHRQTLLEQDGWDDEKRVEQCRHDWAERYRRQYPKRTKIPNKILNWKPKPDESRDSIMSLYEEDYDLRQILAFEKLFLGYYWHSPCDLYHVSGDHTVENAKITGKLEGVVSKREYGYTRNNSKMLRLWVTDGRKECLVFLWQNELEMQDRTLLEVDAGVRLYVDYDEDRNSFSLRRSAMIEPLWSKKAWEDLAAGELPDEVYA